MQLFIDLLDIPTEPLGVLDPLEVRDRDASGIGKDVGHDRDPLLTQDPVGRRGGGAVGGFDQQLRVDPVGVAGMDDALDRGGDQDVALELEQVVVADRISVRVALHPAFGLRVLEDRIDVEAVGVVDPTGYVRNGTDAGAVLGRQRSGPEADVAEPLDHDASALEGDVELLRDLLGAHDHAAAGRLFAAWRPTQLHRLAGDDARRVAILLSVLVHHPGHGLSIGPHVGGRDVAVHSDDVRDHRGEASGQSLQLGQRQLAGIALHAALGSSERNVYEGVLPGHQRGKSPNLVEVRRRMESDTSLVRAPGPVVLNAVAATHGHGSVVHTQRHLHTHLAVRAGQDLAAMIGEVQALCGPMEEVRGRLERRHVIGRFTRWLGHTSRIGLLVLGFRRLVGPLPHRAEITPMVPAQPSRPSHLGLSPSRPGSVRPRRPRFARRTARSACPCAPSMRTARRSPT